MARITMADVAKFKAFLDAVLAANPTGEFELWDYEPWCEKNGESEDLFGWGDDDDDAEPMWVRKDEQKIFPRAKSIDKLIEKVSRTHKVREMDNGRWYVA